MRTFRLWAPAKDAVSLQIEGRGPIAMRGSDGCFEAQADCKAGDRYRFALGDERVPDPRSHFQSHDVHGPSEVVDHAAYAWKHPGWRGRPWPETVIYELHVGACGGFVGVREKLPHFRSLGVTAIELMPLADFSGKRNWGYDGVLPYAPDSSYGRPDDLKALIDAAHGEGLQVFLDVVYNHFGPDGNFLHVYAPQFFRDDVQTPWGAAIDFRRREVRAFFIRNALHWLVDYRFDGLRFDAVHAIHSDDFLPELAQRVRETIPDRHVHLMLENEHNQAELLGGARYDAQWHDQFHNAIHVLLTRENEGYYGKFADAPAEKLASALSGLRADADVPPTSLIAFLQNHDQVGNRAFGERLIALTDEGALRAATVVLLLCPQIPLLFMGEEWGCRAPFLFFTDFHDELADAVREGRRREFAKFKAFADPQQRAKIPDPNAEDTFRRSMPDFAECSRPEHARWLSFYRELLALRAREIVPRLAASRSEGAKVIGSAAIDARWRLGDGAQLRILLNLDRLPAATEPIHAPLLYAVGEECAAALASGVVPAFSACVLLEAA